MHNVEWVVCTPLFFKPSAVLALSIFVIQLMPLFRSWVRFFLAMVRVPSLGDGYPFMYAIILPRRVCVPFLPCVPVPCISIAPPLISNVLVFVVIVLFVLYFHCGVVDLR